MISKILLILMIVSSAVIGQWTKVPEVPETTNIPSFCIEGETIYAGGDSVIYISTNNGENWSVSSRISSDVDFVSAVKKYNNRIFVGTYNYGVFESSDFGTTWIEGSNGLVGSGAKTISDFVIRDNKLYASTYGSGIFVLDLIDNNEWHTFNNGIPSNISYNVNSLTVFDGVLYAGAGGNGFYYTNNSGSHVWIEHQFGIINVEPLSFYDIIFLAQNQIIVSSYGLYKSTDNGNIWNFVSTGSGYLQSGNFINNGSEIFAAMTKISGTIWMKSSDNGDSWNLWEQTLWATTLNAIFAAGKIFDGRLNGLWYREVNPSGADDVDNIPTEFILNQNYPNPFNPTTRICYTVPPNVKREMSNVTLKVFDMLGREAATLVNEEKPAGTYEVEFNAKQTTNNSQNGKQQITGGVYFYQLKIGDYIITKKMIFLK